MLPDLGMRAEFQRNFVGRARAYARTLARRRQAPAKKDIHIIIISNSVLCAVLCAVSLSVPLAVLCLSSNVQSISSLRVLLAVLCAVLCAVLFISG